MAVLSFSLMNEEVPEGTFHCGNNSIERQISSAYYATLLQQAYGYKVMLSNKIVGYYMICPRRIELATMNRIEGDEYNSGATDCFMALHINYLAIDEKYHRQSIGTYTLKGIIRTVERISQQIPIRLITIDALAYYHEWYMAIGFRDIPGIKVVDDIIPMYMDCISDMRKKLLDDYCEV